MKSLVDKGLLTFSEKGSKVLQNTEAIRVAARGLIIDATKIGL